MEFEFFEYELKIMNVCVIGTGYVGLVAGPCLAGLGHEVICVDIDKAKIDALNAGKVPIYEPGLDELIKKNASKLKFSTNLEEAVKASEVIFLAVGTPQSNDGSADLKYVLQVAEDISKFLDENSEKVVVNKSTVPVGTGEKVRAVIEKNFSGKFHIVSNPEFLREGSAITDFMEPDRVVVGSDAEFAQKKMGELYAPLNAKVLFTDIKTAELIKYASNAFLAVKISFINEIANLCDKVDADVSLVAEGMGLDKRIGEHFLKPGPGWGGSCFPKDVKALIHIAKENGIDLKIANAAQEVNDSQKVLLVKKAESLLGSLEGKKIALLGLAFKCDTDDIREASSLTIIKELLEKKATVSAYDPLAMPAVKEKFSEVGFCDSALDCVKDADALFLVTDWKEFLELDFAKVKELMAQPIVLDGRNFLDSEKLKELSFKYVGIGKK